MAFMAFAPSSLTGGTLHHYTRTLVAYEWAAPQGASEIPPANINTVVFIGGLSDGLMTVPYTTPLSKRLPSSWRLLQPLLKSSYVGWGITSLDGDVDDLTRLFGYIKSIRPNGKIVVMGHSTGCQDAMHYLTSPMLEDSLERPAIEGAVLQAPVSDRESLDFLVPSSQLEATNRMAENWVATGKGDDVLPRGMTDAFFGATVTARRLLSLTSPGPAHIGQDDYFSSDLSEIRIKSTFGKVGAKARMLLLYSGNDEFAPHFVDKEVLLWRWRKAIEGGGGTVDEGSAVVDGADHALKRCTEQVVEDIFGRIVRFLGRIEGKSSL